MNERAVQGVVAADRWRKWGQVWVDVKVRWPLTSVGGDLSHHGCTLPAHTHIKLSSETLQQVACTVQPFQPEWNCVRFSPVYITVCARQRKCALDFISIAPALKISSDGVIKWREGWWHTHIRPRETLIKHTPDNLTHIYAEEFITVSMKQHFTSVLWWIFF